MKLFRYMYLYLLLISFGCSSRGHVPHYILTDSPETKKEVHKYQDIAQPSALHEEEISPEEEQH